MHFFATDPLIVCKFPDPSIYDHEVVKVQHNVVHVMDPGISTSAQASLAIARERAGYFKLRTFPFLAESTRILDIPTADPAMDYLKKFKKNRDKTPDGSTTRELPPEDVLKDDEKEKDAKTKDSMTDKAMSFMRPYYTQAKSWTAKEASDAKKDLQKSLGLGGKPDVLPQGEALVVGEPRTVELGWHPVAGATGKWFAEKTMIGKQISQKIGKYPDPTQHWAVIVGDYVHQLWMVRFNQYQKLSCPRLIILMLNVGRESRHYLHKREAQTRRLDIIRSRHDTFQRSSTWRG